MPIYKYKNSKGQVMYYLKVSYKGKQYLKRGFASKKDAREYELNFIDNYQNNKLEKRNVTFKFASEQFLKKYKTRCKLSSFDVKFRRIHFHLISYFGLKRVNEITLNDFQSFIELKLKENLNATYINKLICDFKQILIFSKDYLSCQNDIYLKIDKLNDYLIKKNIEYLSIEDIKKFLSVIPSSDYKMMFIVFALMLLVYLVQMGCTWIRIKWGHILGVWIENDMRRDIFSHLQVLSFSYYDKTKTGTLMSRITNDLFNIAEVAHHCPEDFLISILTIAAAYVAMFSFSVPLALVTLIPLPIMLIYGVIYNGRLKRKNRAVRRTVADIAVDVENSIQGIREVKGYSQEKFQEKKFDKSNNRLKETREKYYAVMAAYQSGISFMREMYYFITVVGGVLLISRGTVSVSDLVSFILFVSVVLPPIDRLINFTEQFSQGVASFERFVEVMETEPEIKDDEDAVELKVTDAEIAFDDVSFSYTHDGEEKTIKNLCLTIPGGSHVALVGESGAGKSTIANLLARFYELDGGRITIDGTDIAHVSQKSLHEAIGFVRQDVFLFDASIRENLRYGKSDASDEELYVALEKANLLDFVKSLPNGLDTEVGERGTRLSGGQKQRLSIARCFLKNPPIIVFDEATSSLDTESEALIEESFLKLRSGRTSIVIAHRLSTVIDSDIIFVIDDGKLSEVGNHQSLMEKGGIYSRLYKKGSNA